MKTTEVLHIVKNLIKEDVYECCEASMDKEKVTNTEMVEVSELVSTIQDTQDQIEEIEDKLKAKKEVYRRLTEDDLP